MNAKEDTTADRNTVKRNVENWRRTHKCHPTPMQPFEVHYLELQRDIHQGRMVSVYENWPSR